MQKYNLSTAYPVQNTYYAHYMGVAATTGGSPTTLPEEDPEETPNNVPNPKISLRPISTEVLSREVFGGKAHGLSKLINRGFAVPRAWVIPCSASLTKPLLDLSALPKSTNPQLYSVRSGAAVSMPGMLATKLNVPRGEVRKSIKAVWESWNSPHAVQYRNDNNIPHDTGTAVIVQKMPTNITHSGVMMTAAAGDAANKSTLKIGIEYVEGTGDALVGGTSSGVVATKVNLPCYHLLRDWGEVLHAEWGPSDIEWCYSKVSSNLYFIQWRPMTFPPPQVEEEDQGRKAVAVGNSIGAKGTAVAHLSFGDSKEDSYILFVQDFLPELYPIMQRAAAILCQNGGEFCHAGIIGRAMGKPSISGIHYGDICNYLNQPLRVNGATGSITIPLTSDLPSESTGTLEIKSSYNPVVPDLSIRNYKWKADALLWRFYSSIAAHEAGDMSAARLDEVVHEMAQILATYQYIICACECRYSSEILPGHIKDFPHYSKGNELFPTSIRIKEEFNLALEDLRSHGIPMPEPWVNKLGRQEFADTIEQPTSLADAIETMELVSKMFHHPAWNAKTSIGGKKWAKITDYLISYLKGEIPSLLYVDGCFNIQHNGGNYFNKFGWMSQGNVQQYLNNKATSYAALAKCVNPLTLERPEVTAHSLIELAHVNPLSNKEENEDASE